MKGSTTQQSAGRVRRRRQSHTAHQPTIAHPASDSQCVRALSTPSVSTVSAATSTQGEPLFRGAMSVVAAARSRPLPAPSHASNAADSGVLLAGQERGGQAGGAAVRSAACDARKGRHRCHAASTTCTGAHPIDPVCSCCAAGEPDVSSPAAVVPPAAAAAATTAHTRSSVPSCRPDSMAGSRLGRGGSCATARGSPATEHKVP